jgi:hypothetical protein
MFGAFCAKGATDPGVSAKAGATPAMNPREAAAETARRCIDRIVNSSMRLVA